ncbi:MAG: isopenicillin N synthase family dioxygenase [Ilumatobacteraceae bacterium]
MSWVPVVDLGAADAVAAVADACERVGFLTVVGHGVPDEVVQGGWDSARQFFDLPLADRMRVAMPRPGYPYGYSPVRGETLSASLGKGGHPDLKQSFAIGPVDPAMHAFADPDEAFAWSPNLWPEALPAMRPAWEAYYRAMADLSARLLRVMALALDLPERHFDPLIGRHTSAMRALDYPPAGEDGVAADGQLGASAHTDYGTLTVLLADTTQGGLQVQDADGGWHDAMPVPGSLVVNLGDAMARWTNDRWRSTMHRVVVPERRRQSIAFFHNANWDALIECIPSCREPGASPRYAPMAAGPHLMHKFRSTVNTY